MNFLSLDQLENYQKIAKEIRRKTLKIIYRTCSPHVGSSFSMVELLVALYFRCLKNSPQKCHEKGRDKFILSKGHACPSYYVTLAKRGYLPQEMLENFAVDGGTLEQHPNYDPGCGVELSTGSLGHGLPVGAGMALAAKHDNLDSRVFVILGDGELNEGTNWESIMFSGHHKLDNLVAIVDYNKYQILGSTTEVMNLEPLAKKWESFGWGVKEINGHDFKEIIEALENIPLEKNKPSVIIAHTIKGKGISFMENDNVWHSKCPNEEEYKKALSEFA